MIVHASLPSARLMRTSEVRMGAAVWTGAGPLDHHVEESHWLVRNRVLDLM